MDKTDEKLLEMMRIELEKLHSYHPYTQPGLFDVSVENIQAIRATMYVNQGHNMQKSLKGGSDD